MNTTILAYECSRPFWDLIANGNLFDWLMCPYTIGGLGLTGMGLFIVGLPFVGMMNWSESYRVPLVWLAIAVPAMSATLLPGPVLRRIAGVITVAFALLIVGLYWWWGSG